MKSFNIIVAIDSGNGIGKGGFMPWNLPGDLKHFKEVTCRVNDPSKRNVVIMGRKTWDSIPDKFKPLQDRINLVLTRNKLLKFPEGVLTVDSFEKGLEILSKDFGDKIGDIFIIGGEEIFKQALAHQNCQKIFVTHIIKTFDCDTFFPSLENRWHQVSKSAVQEENSIKYYFSEYNLQS